MRRGVADGLKDHGNRDKSNPYIRSSVTVRIRRV